MLSPEAKRIQQDPRVQGLVDHARNSMQPDYFHMEMPSIGILAELRREGRYTLRDVHGFDFNAVLLRINTPNNPEILQSGGELRFLPNHLMQARVSGCAPEELSDPDIPPIIISDQIPIFLKELSLWKVQSKLEESRFRVATAAKPAVLIQTRASDIHDGQFRFRPEGQHDINEEIWYAKVFTVMHRFPGISVTDAEQLLQQHGYGKTVPDIADLSVDAAIAYYYRGDKPKSADIIHLTADQFIDPFPAENTASFTIDDVNITLEEFHRLILGANPINPEEIVHEGKKYTVEVLADYPVLVDGLVFRSRLFRSTEEDGITFHTFRSLERGDIKDAYVRMDSICINGVQGGDCHCDCRSQLEHERHRAKEGAAIFFLSLRDHEGRGHGEGPKGATLELMRRINELGDYKIGNGIAAEIFYDSTGFPVDRRDYGPALTVFKYLKLKRIKHLVTNNRAKIDMLMSVVDIEKIVSAQVYGKLTLEAQRTIQEKANGSTGTSYILYELGER